MTRKLVCHSVVSSCSGKQSCSLPVSSLEDLKPCPEEFDMYLNVVHTCVAGKWRKNQMVGHFPIFCATWFEERLIEWWGESQDPQSKHVLVWILDFSGYSWLQSHLNFFHIHMLTKPCEQSKSGTNLIWFLLAGKTVSSGTSAANVSWMLELIILLSCCFIKLPFELAKRFISWMLGITELESAKR